MCVWELSVRRAKNARIYFSFCHHYQPLAFVECAAAIIINKELL